MADVTKVKSILDTYGVGVRAGVITPCLEDEITIRALLELPEMPASVRAKWQEQGGIRLPITLQQPESAMATPGGAADNSEEDEEEDV